MVERELTTNSVVSNMEDVYERLCQVVVWTKLITRPLDYTLVVIDVLEYWLYVPVDIQVTNIEAPNSYVGYLKHLYYP
jgi:hypothetical protein